MQWLSLVPEESTVRRVQADSARAPLLRAVAATPPAPSLHRFDSRPAPAAPRRGHERRTGGDRRRRQVPVLLDTRCGKERRQSDPPSVDDPAGRTGRRSIDLYA